MEIIKIKTIERGGEAPSLPQYQTDGAAGVDLSAFLQQDLHLAPMERALIPTGLIFQIPAGFGGFVFARSGLASKTGLTMANGVGVIDSDYRGELLVAMVNLSDTEVVVKNGDRIAQFLLLPTPKMAFEEGDFTPTQRGDRGFGSTGVRHE